MAEEVSGLLIALCREPPPLWTEMKELLAWLCFHCAKINTYSHRPRREITHQPVDFTGHLIRSCTPQNKTIYCLKRQGFYNQYVFKWGTWLRHYVQFIQLKPTRIKKTAQKTVGLGLALAELSLISVIIASLF